MTRWVRVMATSWVGALACVATNPDWDAPAATDSAGGDATTSSDEVTSLADATSVTDATTLGDATSVADATTLADATSVADESTTADTGISACQDAAPAEGACPEGCDSCDDGVCTLSCEGEQACNGMMMGMLDCPPGWPCRVVCNGKQACKDAKITCAPEHACEVECTGELSCEKTKITCSDGPCNAHCVGHPQACKGMTLACGASDSTIECSGFQDDPPKVMAAMGSTCGCTVEGCAP